MAVRYVRNRREGGGDRGKAGLKWVCDGVVGVGVV